MSQGLVCRRCGKYISAGELWGFHERCAHEEFATYLQEIQALRADPAAANTHAEEAEKKISWYIDYANGKDRDVCAEMKRANMAEAEVDALREVIEWALSQADCFNEKMPAELRHRTDAALKRGI